MAGWKIDQVEFQNDWRCFPIAFPCTADGEYTLNCAHAETDVVP